MFCIHQNNTFSFILFFQINRMCLLKNNKQISLERDLNSYLKTKPSDCILYSEDGAEFEIHKVLIGQTKFMREILKSAKDHCCITLEIICPCSKEELEKLVYFLYNGEIHCEDIFDSYIVQEDLTKIFGYPEFLNVDGQITSFLGDPVVSSILDTAIFESTELTLLSDTDLNNNLFGESNEIDKNFDRIDQSNSNAESFKNTTLQRLKTSTLLDKADFRSTEESNNFIHENSNMVTDLNNNLIGKSSENDKNFDSIDQSTFNEESKKNPTLDQPSNAFSQKNISHQKKKHLNPKLHACKECQIVFLTKAKLDIHLKIVHQKFEHFSCQFCDRSFLLRIQLKNHQMREHSSQKKELISNLKSVYEKPLFKCQYCEKPAFSSRILLKDHEKKEHSNQCKKCQRTFFTKAELNSHFKLVHEKSILFKCQYCEKSFSLRILLNNHERRGHSNKGEDSIKRKNNFESI